MKLCKKISRGSLFIQYSSRAPWWGFRSVPNEPKPFSYTENPLSKDNRVLWRLGLGWVAIGWVCCSIEAMAQKLGEDAAGGCGIEELHWIVQE